MAPHSPLLLLTRLFLTFRLRGIQFTKLWYALYMGLVVRKEKGVEGDISHFQALMTALAATVGTGNIVGVATAIAAGGPGALFAAFVGTVRSLDFVRTLSDVMNGLMALPNLIGLLLLSGLVARETRAYLRESAG